MSNFSSLEIVVVLLCLFLYITYCLLYHVHETPWPRMRLSLQQSSDAGGPKKFYTIMRKQTARNTATSKVMYNLHNISLSREAKNYEPDTTSPYK